MKKITYYTVIVLLPFLIVWIAFIMTGFSFSPREVFQRESFWGLSVLYWALLMWGPIYLVSEEMKEA